MVQEISITKTVSIIFNYFLTRENSFLIIAILNLNTTKTKIALPSVEMLFVFLKLCNCSVNDYVVISYAWYCICYFGGSTSYNPSTNKPTFCFKARSTIIITKVKSLYSGSPNPNAMEVFSIGRKSEALNTFHCREAHSTVSRSNKW